MPKSEDDVRPLTIPRKVAVQGLNVSVAASVVVYESIRQYP
jgi:tRNA G18 (ribose-2'-O)-methylase SpoU